MDRLELVRMLVDQEIAKLSEESERKYAYIHTYGVAQACSMLAALRKVDIELACISAMLHDIAIYKENSPHKDHANRSGIIAKEILEQTNVFEEREITIITHAILSHSDKANRHDGALAELLKDGDVLQHYLYNVNIEISSKDKVRLFYLLEELKHQHPNELI